QQQRMVALTLVTVELLVFVTSRSFQIVWLVQHCASYFPKSCSTRRLYSVSAGSISWCAGHIAGARAVLFYNQRIRSQAVEDALLKFSELLMKEGAPESQFPRLWLKSVDEFYKDAPVSEQEEVKNFVTPCYNSLCEKKTHSSCPPRVGPPNDAPTVLSPM